MRRLGGQLSQRFGRARSLAAAFAHVFQDTFTTAASAGAVNGTAVEPIVQALTRTVTDTAGTKTTISGGRLKHASPPTAGFTDPRYLTATFTRAPGRTLSFVCKGANIYAGFAGAAGNGQHGVYFNNTALLPLDDGSGISTGLTISTTTDYTVWVILRRVGALLYIQGGAFTVPTLLWASNTNSADQRIALACGGSTGALEYDDALVHDYGGASGQRFGLGVGHYAPQSGDTFTIAANALIEMNWLPATSEVLTIVFRQSDADNYWSVVCTQGASGGTVINEVVAGVTTPRATAVNAWNVAQYRIMIVVNGASIRVYANKALITSYATAATHLTATGASITSTATRLNTAISSAACEFAAWPYAPGGAFPPDGARPHYLFCAGDSTTNGSGDTAIPPGLGFNGYPPELCRLLDAATGYGWHEIARLGVGGATAATYKAAIDANLAAIAATPAPDAVLFDLGTNDLSAPNVSTFETNIAYILDAIHTKWPAAVVYVAIPWVKTRDSEADILAGRLATVRSTRAWTALGIDKRVVVKAADDGLAYLSADNIHPNRAGYVAIGAAWKTAMGF